MPIYLDHPRTYRSWKGMFYRTRHPQNPAYPNYGGRGIKVCERWESFQNFYEDMGERPDGMTLDRRDNDGNYEPGNCRWATRLEQTHNRRKRLLCVGQKAFTLTEWAELVGMKYMTLYARLERGWSPVKAIFTPVRGVAA